MDVINIIEFYINQIVYKTKEEDAKINPMYYKNIRSNIYDKEKICNSTTEIYHKHHKKYIIILVTEAVMAKG